MSAENFFQQLGPLEALLEQPDIMEIMVNGYDQIFVERHGKIERVNDQFRDDDHLMQIIQLILEPMGQHVSESNPIVDVRLPDASRVHVVIPPIALTGPSLTIRKMIQRPVSMDDLLGWGSLSQEIATFLQACVAARLNMIISGGTGSGKTTLMNVICQSIPNDERIIVLQNDAELALKQEHVVVLETRPANLEGRGEITMQQLVESAVKMRPDRLVVAELRGPEVGDLIQAFNNGYDGSLLSLHAISPVDALTRLEIMALEANPSLPLLSLRQLMASAFDVIVQIDRLHDGRRRAVRISEVAGLRGDLIVLNDLFEYVVTGQGEDGKLEGVFAPTGRVPIFMQQLDRADTHLPASMFTPTYDILRRVPPPPPPVPPIPPMPPTAPKPFRRSRL